MTNFLDEKVIVCTELIVLGGVAIYVNKKISYKIVQRHSNYSIFENLFLEIFSKKLDFKSLIRCIYDHLEYIIYRISLNTQIQYKYLENILLEYMPSLGMHFVNKTFPTNFSTAPNTLLDT